MSRKTLLIVGVVVAIAVLAVIVYLIAAAVFGPAGQLRELDANAEKWQNQNITHYRMKVGIGCFCPFYDRMPLTVEVLNGKVLSVTDSQGQPVPEDDPIRLHGNEDLLTIEGIFNYSRQAIQTADETTIDYDPYLGYPVSLGIDQIKRAMDDELSVAVTDLHALP